MIKVKPGKEKKSKLINTRGVAPTWEGTGDYYRVDRPERERKSQTFKPKKKKKTWAFKPTDSSSSTQSFSGMYCTFLSNLSIYFISFQQNTDLIPGYKNSIKMDH